MQTYRGNRILLSAKKKSIFSFIFLTKTFVLQSISTVIFDRYGANVIFHAYHNIIIFFSELDTPGSDNGLDSSLLSTLNSSKNLNRSSSNPDLSPSSISNKSISSSNGVINDEDSSTFVVKVYRSDQSYKYFPILKDTTAKQVVMLAITEFNIGDQSRYI